MSSADPAGSWKERLFTGHKAQRRLAFGFLGVVAYAILAVNFVPPWAQADVLRHRFQPELFQLRAALASESNEAVTTCVKELLRNEAIVDVSCPPHFPRVMKGGWTVLFSSPTRARPYAVNVMYNRHGRFYVYEEHLEDGITIELWIDGPSL